MWLARDGEYLAHCENPFISRLTQSIGQYHIPLLNGRDIRAIAMSKNDVLKAIREAELEAKKILEEANKKASYVVSAARSDA